MCLHGLQKDDKTSILSKEALWYAVISMVIHQKQNRLMLEDVWMVIKTKKYFDWIF